MDTDPATVPVAVMAIEEAPLKEKEDAATSGGDPRPVALRFDGRR
jgi:hypothetical protein